MHPVQCILANGCLPRGTEAIWNTSIGWCATWHTPIGQGALHRVHGRFSRQNDVKQYIQECKQTTYPIYPCIVCNFQGMKLKDKKE